MLVLISPAKTMKEQKSVSKDVTEPRLLQYSKQVLDQLKTFSAMELQKMMKMNDTLAALNYERYQTMNLDKQGIPAIYFYDGIQYKSMELDALEEDHKAYLNQTVRILSGMYGVLRPTDGIWPYRLELQQKGITIGEHKTLYDFWQDPVWNLLQEELEAKMLNNTECGSEKILVNLASNEYSKLLTKKLIEADCTFVTCTFQVKKGERLRVESTASKKARGQMVHYIARHQVKTMKDLMKFDVDGYAYHEELSSLNNPREIELVYVKTV